ncbi:MAG: hypothetical protein LBV51_01570 [Acholeplasmatales bacterium]|jgi:hypothetical protein|nr:hypothetical protein [Acholeplasmatales bacterium]
MWRIIKFIIIGIVIIIVGVPLAIVLSLWKTYTPPTIESNGKDSALEGIYSSIDSFLANQTVNAKNTLELGVQEDPINYEIKAILDKVLEDRIQISYLEIKGAWVIFDENKITIEAGAKFGFYNSGVTIVLIPDLSTPNYTLELKTLKIGNLNLKLFKWVGDIVVNAIFKKNISALVEDFLTVEIDNEDITLAEVDFDHYIVSASRDNLVKLATKYLPSQYEGIIGLGKSIIFDQGMLDILFHKGLVGAGINLGNIRDTSYNEIPEYLKFNSEDAMINYIKVMTTTMLLSSILFPNSDGKSFMTIDQLSFNRVIDFYLRDTEIFPINYAVGPNDAHSYSVEGMVPYVDITNGALYLKVSIAVYTEESKALGSVFRTSILLDATPVIENDDPATSVDESNCLILQIGNNIKIGDGLDIDIDEIYSLIKDLLGNATSGASEFFDIDKKQIKLEGFKDYFSSSYLAYDGMSVEEGMFKVYLTPNPENDPDDIEVIILIVEKVKHLLEEGLLDELNNTFPSLGLYELEILGNMNAYDDVIGNLINLTDSEKEVFYNIVTEALVIAIMNDPAITGELSDWIGFGN